MLKLINVKKDYVMADSKVHALKGVSIDFRESEFVSILGPSGCGKTTLLNIIGGLDKLTDGEIYIDNISTRKYSSRDWDTYRNHRIGFIFQSYNLIPHQTILENVELALKIAGLRRSQITRKAKKALDSVGLKGLYKKKPNQLSGGQCQRVAIARALVNEPDILLADEPTGALDSKTSVQIMELIKKISKEKLVIMVTHNGELAKEYSTRIIKLFDGEVISDSNKFKSKLIENAAKEKVKKSKLRSWESFKLSFRNLISKAKRTILVCFAGSIGIIGVSTVLSVSNGISSYIASMENDMLSGNPIQITKSAMDMSQLMSLSLSDDISGLKENLKDGHILIDKYIEFLIEKGDQVTSLMVENEITQDYIDYIKNMPSDYYTCLDFDYDLVVKNNIYSNYDLNGYEENTMMSLSALESMYTDMLQHTEYKKYSSFISMFTDTFRRILDNEDFVMSQYEFVSDKEKSHFPKDKDEIVLVLDNDEMINDILLAQCGYYSQEEFINTIYKASGSEKYNKDIYRDSIAIDELINKKFSWYPNDVCYTKNTNPMSPVKFNYNHIVNDTFENGIDFKITGVLKLKEGLNYGCLSKGFYYTKAFSDFALEDSFNSEIVNFLKDNNQDSFTSTMYKMDQSSSISFPVGVHYIYKYYLDGTLYDNVNGFVGSYSAMANVISQMIGSSSIYTLTLRDLGGEELPSSISIYSESFDDKDLVTEYLDDWNSENDIQIGDRVITKENRKDILYQDALSIVIAIISTMINIVTYALVSFTSLSLVVSTVMIAIITYVSVIERIKEIGVIRALGGRKKDVKRLFMAETFIIGLISGLIGVGMTYLISFIIDAIVGSLSGIYTIALFDPNAAIIMVCVSIVLTLISGLIPASLAAKKDPVVALRTE